MITTRLYGRHSNQLFQIANCIAVATRHGLVYHIPAHTLTDKEYPPAITHLENPNYDPSLPSITIKEVQHNYKEIPLPAFHENKNIILDGYFQSELYFKDYIDDVRTALGYNYSPSDNYCAVHWRFGDYRRYPTKHPIVTNQYMELAIELMIERGIDKFIFFSDEIEECEKWLDTSNKKFKGYFSFSKEKDAKKDFQTMLHCSHFIISNSTYSLMAAILSKSENKICISPAKSQWFGHENFHLSTDTIIPESFIQIKF